MDRLSVPPELSIVVPTLNELDNVPLLLKRLESATRLFSWEIIFVDDNSSDGTAQAIADMAESDRRIYLLERRSQRGLASASIAGMRVATGLFIAVMDADGQHDEAMLWPMLSELRYHATELVICTRYHTDASMKQFPFRRRALSTLGTWLVRLTLAQQAITDPLSGFFMIRRNLFSRIHTDLSVRGFKTLLSVLAVLPLTTCILEIPYTFRARERGRSKVTASLALRCLGDLVRYYADQSLTGRHE